MSERLRELQELQRRRQPVPTGSQAHTASPVPATSPGRATPPAPPVPHGQAVPSAEQRTNRMAIASLVLGVLWIWWLGSILALVLGYKAKRQIDSSAGAEGGSGPAIAGIVLGWIGVGTFVLVIALGTAGTLAGL